MIDSVIRYSATITAGGLMLPDARRVAALMQLTGVAAEAIVQPARRSGTAGPLTAARESPWN